MIIDSIFLLIGFLMLVEGANLLVKGASNIASSLRIPNIIIGLTIVALGTSAPETAISVASSINGNNGVLLGNIIGSNIFNLLVVLGITGILKPHKNASGEVLKDFWFSMLVSFMLLFLVSDIFLFKHSYNMLTRTDGLILILMLIVYFVLVIKRAISMKKFTLSLERRKLKLSDILFFIVGLLMLFVGGDWVVSNASSIANKLNISDGIIGLTIVALGTSLPELITGIVALAKEEEEIALGNIVGSNILNILFTLGISSLINPIVVPISMYRDIIIMIMIFFIVYYLLFKKSKFQKLDGLILVIIYIIYIVMLYI